MSGRRHPNSRCILLNSLKKVYPIKIASITFNLSESSTSSMNLYELAKFIPNLTKYQNSSRTCKMSINLVNLSSWSVNGGDMSVNLSHVTLTLFNSVEPT